MNRRGLMIIAWIAGLLLLGALAGRLAGPLLARRHPAVQTAERIWLEESRGLAERTPQSTAFRQGGLGTARTIPELYAEARAVRGRFARGAVWFGLWCGLVAGLRSASIWRGRPPAEYEADRGRCLACARCFWACPLERERAKGRVS